MHGFKREIGLLLSTASFAVGSDRFFYTDGVLTRRRTCAWFVLPFGVC